MSFVSDIVDGIESAASSIFSVGKSVVSSASSFNLGSLTDVFGSITNVVKGISSVVTDVSSLINSTIKPLTDTIQSVTNLANQINDQLIKPIVTPIETTINTFEKLQNEIDLSLKEGLKGLVQIPGEIADALTQVNASYQRSTQELAKAQGSIASDTLVPGFHKAFSDGIGLWTEAFNKAFTVPETGEGFSGSVHLAQPADIQDYIDKYDVWLKAILDDTSWYAPLMRFLVSAAQFIPYIVANLEHIIKEAEYAANKNYPVDRLPVNESLAAWSRKIINDDDLTGELKEQGWDDTRIQVLKDLLTYLPSVEQAAMWFYRGYIGEGDYGNIASTHQYKESDAKNVLEAMLQSPNPTERTRLQPRFDALGKNFLSETLNSNLPENLKENYQFALVNPAQGDLDWLAHWNIPPPAWWVQAFFRKIRTRSECYDAFAAQAIPKELWDDLFVTEQTLLSPFILMDVVKGGQFNRDEAIDWAKQVGLPDSVAIKLVDTALISGKTSTSDTAAALQGLSLTTAKTLFADGAIDAATYKDLLLTHGLGSEAADLTVQLEQLTLDTQARKDNAQYIVNLVNLGAATIDEAVAELFSEGYSDQEVASYQLKMKQAKQANVKLPSKSDLDAMLEKGIIDAQTYQSTMSLLGYSTEWTDRYILLLQAEGKLS